MVEIELNSRPRVLLIAEAANPEWVSVPLIGWSLARALSSVAQVHIVTQIRNRDAFIKAGLIEGQDFTAIDSEGVARPLWKLGNFLRMGEGKGWTALQAVSALSYPYFERQVWKQFRQRILSGAFDIVHRITPLSPTITSPLAKKCCHANVPFVLGPLNGGVPWPKGFDHARRQEREYLSYIRGVYKLFPGQRSTYQNAAAILVGSRHTAGEISNKHHHKTIYLPENAIDLTKFSKHAAAAKAPLAACFIGRMVPYKGPDMLIEAASELLRSGKMTLDMIGDGPMLSDLKATAEKIGIGAGLRFHGWLDQSKLQQVLAKTNLLAFPSIREFGGGVVLEAMALGVVPMVVDYAGPGELVTAHTGYRIPLGNRAEIIAGFRQNLTRVSQSPKELIPLAKQARSRVQSHFTWQAKAAQIAQIYDWVLNPKKERPSFFDDSN